MDIMQVYGRTHDYQNAIKYANISLNLTHKNQNKVLEAEVYKELSAYESQVGNAEPMLLIF